MTDHADFWQQIHKRCSLAQSRCWPLSGTPIFWCTFLWRIWWGKNLIPGSFGANSRTKKLIFSVIFHHFWLFFLEFLIRKMFAVLENLSTASTKLISRLCLEVENWPKTAFSRLCGRYKWATGKTQSCFSRHPSRTKNSARSGLRFNRIYNLTIQNRITLIM